MKEWNNSNSTFFAGNIPSKVKEQLYAAVYKKVQNFRLYEYSNVCFVYNLHILDYIGCPDKKGRSFRK